MNFAGQVNILCVCVGGGGQVAFVFRLPVGQVAFSGLLLTLLKLLQNHHLGTKMTI